MSPTLLELIVAILLLWVAWQIGVLLGPRVVAAFLAFWRDGQTPYVRRDPTRPEKNITPPSDLPDPKAARPKSWPHT